MIRSGLSISSLFGLFTYNPNVKSVFSPRSSVYFIWVHFSLSLTICFILHLSELFRRLPLLGPVVDVLLVLSATLFDLRTNPDTRTTSLVLPTLDVVSSVPVSPSFPDPGRPGAFGPEPSIRCTLPSGVSQTVLLHYERDLPFTSPSFGSLLRACRRVSSLLSRLTSVIIPSVLLCHSPSNTRRDRPK